MLKWPKRFALACIYINISFIMYALSKLSSKTATYVISDPETYEVLFLSSTDYRSSYMCLMSGLETNKIYENGFRPRVKEQELMSFEEELVDSETEEEIEDDLSQEEIDQIFSYFTGSPTRDKTSPFYKSSIPRRTLRPRDGFNKR